MKGECDSLNGSYLIRGLITKITPICVTIGVLGEISDVRLKGMRLSEQRLIGMRPSGMRPNGMRPTGMRPNGMRLTGYG